MVRERIFDYAAAQEGNWTYNIEWGSQKPGDGFDLGLTLLGDDQHRDPEGNTVITKMPPADAMLTVDSVDLVIADCGKPAA